MFTIIAAEDANISGKESYVSFEDAQAALPDKEVYNRPGDDRSTPDWEDDPGAYEFTATISGAVIMNDGVQMGGAGDVFAAFDADGNLRGVGVALFPPFAP